MRTILISTLLGLATLGTLAGLGNNMKPKPIQPIKPVYLSLAELAADPDKYVFEKDIVVEVYAETKNPGQTFWYTLSDHKGTLFEATLEGPHQLDVEGAKSPYHVRLHGEVVDGLTGHWVFRIKRSERL